MIHIDFSTSAVTAEADGRPFPFVTARTLQTSLPCSMSQLSGPSIQTLTESVRSRSGSNLLREFDLGPGEFEVISGQRGASGNRRFVFRVEFTTNEVMRITVLPESDSAPWVINDTLMQSGQGETITFETSVDYRGVGNSEGDVTRIEGSKGGVRFNRLTAWERLLADDPPEPV